MCTGDWRLGRLIRIQQTAYSLAAASTLSFNSNKQRVGIRIGVGAVSTTITNGIIISFDGIDHGFLNPNNANISFTLLADGELPTRAFSIRSTGGTQLGSVIEYFMPEEYLQAGLDEFNRMLVELYAKSKG